MTWDGALCWDSAPPGTTVTQKCPVKYMVHMSEGIVKISRDIKTMNLCLVLSHEIRSIFETH